MVTLPISIVIATRDRPGLLVRSLASLLGGTAAAAEVIVVNGSEDSDGHGELAIALREAVPSCRLECVRAKVVGAATQRNQGVALSTQPFVLFCDDDIIAEEDCLLRLWAAMDADAQLGGVNAMITNQRYQPPGLASRLVFALIDGKRSPSYAGRLIGPAVNFLPDDNEGLPAVVPIEWLNTTCVLYRRSALPDPPFDHHFAGYSLMEDVTLSRRVARGWSLANARTARIYHDSQPGKHKSDQVEMSRMELANRHYVMTSVLGRSRPSDFARLALWETFQLMALFRAGRKPGAIREFLSGKRRAVSDIWRESRKRRRHDRT